MAQVLSVNDLKGHIGKRTLIAAHRGVEGMNIPCNTLEAYEIALSQGADIIETDVAKTADGELIIFHTSTENRQFNDKGLDVTKMTVAEVKEIPLCGSNLGKTQYRVPTLDEALETLKGRCLINLDRAWDLFPEVLKVVDKHNMRQQILLKGGMDDAHYTFLEECAPDIGYLACFGNDGDGWEEVKRRSINLVGAELVFDSEDARICQPKFLKDMHDEGYVAWGNGIVFDYRRILAGGHTDDQSVLGDPDGGWGWFIDREFDIIQTDWTLALAQYLDKRWDR